MLIPVICAFVAITTTASAQDAPNAVAERRSGVDVYIMSWPVRNYEVIDSGKTLVLADCNEAVNKPMKRAAEKGADGVIIYYETARFDIIKYK